MPCRSICARALIAVVLPVLLAGCQSSASSQPYAKPSAAVADSQSLLTSVLAQERAWAGLETRTATIEGQPFTYSIGGPENAPSLLLIHGYTGSRDNWNRVAHYLSRDYRVVVPDMPGHGDTPLVEGQPLEPAKVSALLHKLMKSVARDIYHVAGHSLGGVYAIQLAVYYDENVEAVVLIDSAGIYETNTSDVVARMEAGEEAMVVTRERSLQQIMDMVMADAPFFPKELVAPMSDRQLAHRQSHRRVLDAVLETRGYFTPKTFREGLRYIDSPVLLLWGSDDPLFPPAVTDEILPYFKDGSRIVLDGVGHIPILEAPWRTVEAMRPILERATGTEKGI